MTDPLWVSGVEEVKRCLFFILFSTVVVSN